MDGFLYRRHYPPTAMLDCAWTPTLSLPIEQAIKAKLILGCTLDVRCHISHAPNLQLHSCLRCSLYAGSGFNARCVRRNEGGCPSEMLHYVTGAPRIVPLCTAEHWSRCDVQNLTVVGSNPEETGALLFLDVRHTQPHLHTAMRTQMELFKVFLCHCLKCPQNKHLK